jgi:hypothetical protein
VAKIHWQMPGDLPLIPAETKPKHKFFDERCEDCGDLATYGERGRWWCSSCASPRLKNPEKWFREHGTFDEEAG